MTDLNALIERLSNATGPDRELDAEIFRAIGMPLPEQFMTAKIALEWNETEKCFTFDLAETRVRYEQPPFTSSIDAAMTLVPEGYAASVEWSPRYPGSAWLYPPNNVNDISFEAEATSPALALCAASLKARSPQP